MVLDFCFVKTFTVTGGVAGPAPPATGFPPIHIEQAVASNVTTYYRRVDIYESDGTTIYKRGAALLSGSVTVDMTRAERRTASLSLLNTDGSLTVDRSNGFWYDKVIKIYMGVKDPAGNWEACMGTFLIDTINSKNHSQQVDLTLRDFSKKLSYNIPYPLAWDINTPIEVVISDLAVGGGISPSKIDVPDTTSYIEEDRTFSSGTTRFKAMYDLATAYGYDLYFDVDGVLKMVEFTDPYTSQPQYTFLVGVDSNLSQIDRNISDTLIYNHVPVEGETPEGVPVWGEAFNNDPNSPTRIDRLGIRTKPTIKNSWVVSNAQAVEVAERALKYSSLERYEASLETLIAPWLDVNITVEFADPAAVPGDPTRYLLSQLEFDLGLTPTKAKVGRVTSVISASPTYPASSLYPESTVFPGNA